MEVRISPPRRHLADASRASGMAKPSQPGLVKRVARALGPGLITGAADDDPSGIVTYSMAGAQHGMALLWLAWITWPLMAAVQMMCARIGMVTGKGLGEVLTLKFPRAVVVVACCALFLANTINIAADLAGHQHQNRESAWPRNPADRARPRRRGDRMSNRREFMALLGVAAESTARFLAFAHDIFRPLVGSKPQINGMPHLA